MKTSAIAFTVIFGAIAAACGGGTPEPTTPGTTPTATATSTTSAEDAVPATWSDGLDNKQKAAYMKAKVVPAMAPVFKEHDATRYAEFSCKTCHGPDFKDPKEFLPKLAMKDGKLTAFTEKPEISKWMGEKVMPAMAAAMGQQPYDPATHKGFGCAGCHTMEQK